MKNYITFVIGFAFAILLISCSSRAQTYDDYNEEAEEFAHEHIIVDGHVDLPWRLYGNPQDVSVNTEGDFDYVKAKEGGLNAPFMSIYVPSRYQQTGGAKAYADSLIALVKNLPEKHPDKFAVATSPREIKQQFEKGLISLAMGLENGAPIGEDLSNIQYYYDQGIRYITLTHATDNLISDSSYDTAGTHNGLSNFGYEVVEEMNRVGVMVDVSHISDSAFFDVMEVTEAPVIASHSSARYFTPGWERNMSDEMIERLAENDGIIMISFGSAFVNAASTDSIDAHVEDYLEANNLNRSDAEAQEYIDEYFTQHYNFATIEELADHFDYVVNLVGIEHVGFGSDFDGVGDTLPINLKDASELPNLIQELMARGYTDAELRKICSGNIFRVWNKVDEVAQTMSQNSEAERSN